jgi:hypothetical protein
MDRLQRLLRHYPAKLCCSVSGDRYLGQSISAGTGSENAPGSGPPMKISSGALGTLPSLDAIANGVRHGDLQAKETTDHTDGKAAQDGPELFVVIAQPAIARSLRGWCLRRRGRRRVIGLCSATVHVGKRRKYRAIANPRACPGPCVPKQIGGSALRAEMGRTRSAQFNCVGTRPWWRRGRT